MSTGGGAGTVELRAAPSLGGLYARGVASSAVTATTRRGATLRPADLPDAALMLRGVRPDADRLLAYQQLVGEPVGDVLPAGFVHVLAFPVATALMVRPGFPLPLVGMVHLANAVEQRRPVSVEESLDVRVQARDLRRHRKGAAVDVVAEVSAADDVVWRGVSTYLAKGVRFAGDAAPEEGRREEFRPPVPTGRWVLDTSVGRRYAAVSGDRNPIHTSTAAARLLGFPRRIAHGMYTAARALADVGPARGETFRWEVDFARPVLLPSTVSVRVAAADRADDRGGFDLAVWSRKPHLTGVVRPL